VTDVAMVAVPVDEIDALDRQKHGFQIENATYGKNFFAYWAKDVDSVQVHTFFRVTFADSDSNVGASEFKQKANTFQDPSGWRGPETITLPSLGAFGKAFPSPWGPQGGQFDD
jgi:hypothetical protein